MARSVAYRCVCGMGGSPRKNLGATTSCGKATPVESKATQPGRPRCLHDMPPTDQAQDFLTHRIAITTATHRLGGKG